MKVLQKKKKGLLHNSTSVADELRNVRMAKVQPVTSFLRSTCVFVRQDRRLTVRISIDELNVNRETVKKIVTEDLRMKKLCAKIIP